MDAVSQEPPPQNEFWPRLEEIAFSRSQRFAEAVFPVSAGSPWFNSDCEIQDNSPQFLMFSKTFLVSGLLALLAVAHCRLGAQAAGSAVTLAALRTEYLVAPDNIDSPAPRLSWRLESARRGAAQTAWQIRVASSAARLAAGEGDLWDSGHVTGNASNQIAYAGRALVDGFVASRRLARRVDFLSR